MLLNSKLIEGIETKNSPKNLRRTTGYRLAFVMFLLFFTAFVLHSLYHIYLTDLSTLKVLFYLPLVAIYIVAARKIIPVILQKNPADSKIKNNSKFENSMKHPVLH